MIDVDPPDQRRAPARSAPARSRPARPAPSSSARPTTPIVDELWDACTNPERIPRWFLPVTGDLRLGGRYQLEGNAGGTITECEPPHRFAATWEFGGDVTGSRCAVSDEGDGRARFELEHVALVDAHWDEFGPGAVGIGWDLTVMGLALHLASGGEPVDGEAVMAWTTSTDGPRVHDPEQRGLARRRHRRRHRPRDRQRRRRPNVGRLHRQPDPTGSHVLGAVLELGEAGQEGQVHRADRPVPVLGHDQLGVPVVGLLPVVERIPVDEHHDV